MSSNTNTGYSGNYSSNRDRDDQQNWGKKSGQTNYSGGFSNMDSQNQQQQNLSSTGDQTSGGQFKQNDPRTRQSGSQRGGTRTSGTGYNLTNQDLDYPEE